MRTGRLHPVGHGIYAVGRSDLTREGRWMAAVLACCESAVLSHGSAAALWGIGRERRGSIDVSVRRHCQLSRPGVRIRSRTGLSADDVGERLGIPLTQPVRTLVDLATELSP